MSVELLKIPEYLKIMPNILGHMFLLYYYEVSIPKVSVKIHWTSQFLQIKTCDYISFFIFISKYIHVDIIYM